MLDSDLVGTAIAGVSLLVAILALGASLFALRRSDRSIVTVERFVDESRRQARIQRDLWAQPRAARIMLIGDQLSVATSTIDDTGMLTVVLRNDGNAPASHVRVGVTYPTGAFVKPQVQGDLAPGGELTCEFPLDHARFGEGDSRVFMVDVSYRDRNGLIDRLMPVHLIMAWGADELRYFLGPVDHTIQQVESATGSA
jgi:uncharacterized repeat protein (TIGR01451 family)